MSRGTPEIRRTVAGVHIRVASGTHSARTIRRINDLLTQLGEHGHLAHLKSVARGDLTPLELLDALRGANLAALSRQPSTPLKRAVERFLVSVEAADTHRRNMAYDLRRLVKAAKGASVDDLPALLATERERQKAAGTASGFNHLRNHVSRFVRSLAGRHSAAWAGVRNVEPLKVGTGREHHPCTVPEAFALTQTLGFAAGPFWLGMCLTGMGPSEYVGEWEPVEGGVLIHGTKRAGRDRVVFRVAELERPIVTADAFRRALRRRTDGLVVPYDARRTFQRWCDLAGVPRVHSRGYMGHGPANLQDGYAMGHLAPYVQRDGALFAGFVESELGRPIAGLLSAAAAT